MLVVILSVHISAALVKKGALGPGSMSAVKEVKGIERIEGIGGMFFLAFWEWKSWTALCWKESCDAFVLAESLSLAVRVRVRVGQGMSTRLSTCQYK